MSYYDGIIWLCIVTFEKQDVVGMKGAKTPPDQFFVVVNESEGTIKTLHSTVLLEQMLKSL